MASVSRFSRVRHRFSTDPLFRRNAAFFALGVFSVVGWGMVVLQSPLFLIREVTLEGARGLDPVEAKAALFAMMDAQPGWKLWNPRHRWFFPTSAVEEALRDRWLAERVEVKLNDGLHIVRLIVHEQKIFLWVKTASQWLEVDPRGVIHRELSREEVLQATQQLTGRATRQPQDPFIVDIPTITEPLAQGFKLPYASEDLAAWFSLAKRLQDDAGANLGILYGSHTDKASLAHAEGISIYIDVTENITTQINALEQFLGYTSTLKSKEGKPARFIDVRVPGRIYSQ